MAVASRLPIVLAIALLLAMTESGAQQPPSASRLDLVQREIAGYKSWKAREVALRENPFPRLALDYLRAFAPDLEHGGPFSIRDGEGWSGDEGREAALQRRMKRDMRQWHAVFSLTFLETILSLPESGLYVLMSDLEGNSVEHALAERTRERASRIRENGVSAEHAEAEARSRILSESDRLRAAVLPVIEAAIIRILVRSVHVDPISRRLEIVPRVRGVLMTVAADGRFRSLDERVREGRGSPALPEAIHGAARVVLTEPELDWIWKQNRFAQLLSLFVLLQNEASRDQLLLLYDGFDGFDEFLGDHAFVFDTTLNQQTLEFILSSRQRDPDSELGMDVIDQLTRWIPQRLALVPEELHFERVVDALLLLRQVRPEALEEYIVRFYRDFHAFNPAGYETVILHLAGIVIDYARAGVYAKTTSGAGQAASRQDVHPPHERVMELLVWYNSSLAEVADTLPRIDIDFVDRERRMIVETVLDVLEQSVAGSRPRPRREDPRFVDTLFLLLERVAHVIDPEELETRVLKPYAEALRLDRDPKLSWRRESVTNSSEASLRELMTMMRRHRR